MQSNMEKSTRGTILHLLKMHGALSINELAEHLTITEMAVRRHIQTLERDGFVNSTLTRQAMGRPAHLYSLSAAADNLFPKNYHLLTLDLLQELQAEDEVIVDRLFTRRKERLIHKYSDQMEGKSLEEKVATLADIQNLGGYMVQWDKEEQGYVLHEYNCPISEVANRYNQACNCELELFQSLLNTNVERTECLAKGGGKCTYRIYDTDRKSVV